MSEPAKKIDPASGAQPQKPVFDDVSQSFFDAGEKISKEAEKPILDNEPISSTEGERERKEKKPGRFEFLGKFFRKGRADTDQLDSELDAVKDGRVGAEGEIKITNEEKNKVDELKRAAKENYNKLINSPLIGDIDDQLETLKEIGKALTDEKNNPKIKLAAEDLKIYRDLTKRGSENDKSIQEEGTWKYNKATDEEQARLREIEGPPITNELVAKMAAGEIPWTTNGVFRAASLLYGRKSPLTGKRFGSEAQDAKIYDIKTGKQIGAAVLGAAAAIGLAAADKAPAPDKDAAKSDTEPTKVEKNEAEKYIAVMAAEYGTQLEEALEERTRLAEELANVKNDIEILLVGVKDGLTPIKRADAIKKNIAIVGKYAKLYGERMIDDEKIRAEAKGVSVDDFLKATLGTAEIAGDDPEYLKNIETLFEKARNEMEIISGNLSRRLEELDEKISHIEDKLAFYGSENAPPKAIRHRLIEVNGELAYMAEELAKETDPASPHAKELAASIAVMTKEKEKLEKAAEKFKTAKSAAAKELSPEEILHKEKDEYAAILKTITDRASICREKINDLKHEPAPADRDKRLAALKREMTELEEEGAVMTKRFNDLMARIKEIVPEPYNIDYSPSDTGSSATHDAELSGESDDDDEATATVKPVVPVPIPVTTPSSAATAPGAAGKWEPVVRIKPKRASLAADFSEAKKKPKTGTSMYREGKSEPLTPELDKEGKPKKEKFFSPPNPETEVMVKETMEHAREILAARKEAYTEDIASGDKTLDYFRSLKTRLEKLPHKSAVGKVLTDSANEELRIEGDNVDLILPFVDDLYSRIITDTDEMIALAEKNPTAAAKTPTAAKPRVKVMATAVPIVAAEPKPTIEPKPTKPDTKGEREAAAKIMAEARDKIKAIASELENKEIIELDATGERLSKVEPINIKDEMIKAGCITAEQAERLSRDDIFKIRHELLAAYRKAINGRVTVVRASVPTTSAEPKPASSTPDQTPQQEHRRGVRDEAWKKINATLKNREAILSASDDPEDIAYMEAVLKEISSYQSADDVRRQLKESGLLSGSQANSLKDEETIALRDELEASTRRALESAKARQSKKQPPNGQEPKEPQQGVKIEKEKGGIQDAMSFLSQWADLREKSIDEPGFNLPSYVRTREALDKSLPPESIRQYLIEAGIDNWGKEISPNLSDAELESLRLAELVHLTNIIDKAQPKKETTFKGSLGEIAAANGSKKNGKGNKKGKKKSGQNNPSAGGPDSPKNEAQSTTAKQEAEPTEAPAEKEPAITETATRILPEVWREFASADDGRLKGSFQYLEQYLKKHLGDTLESVFQHPENPVMAVIVVAQPGHEREVLGLTVGSNYRNATDFFDIDNSDGGSFRTIKNVSRAVIFWPGSLDNGNALKLFKKGTVSLG